MHQHAIRTRGKRPRTTYSLNCLPIAHNPLDRNFSVAATAGKLSLIFLFERLLGLTRAGIGEAAFALTHRFRHDLLLSRQPRKINRSFVLHRAVFCLRGRLAMRPHQRSLMKEATVIRRIDII